MLTGVIFCDSDNFVAQQIKSVTGEPDSHVALLFEDTVLHYRFLGFETMFLGEFEQTYVIHSIYTAPEAIMVSPEALVKANHGGAYDFFGMVYVGLWLMSRELGITLPGGNRLEDKKRKFCVEFASECCLGESGSMETPTQFKQRLIARGWHESKQ